MGVLLKVRVSVGARVQEMFCGGWGVGQWDREEWSVGWNLGWWVWRARWWMFKYIFLESMSLESLEQFGI